MSAASFRILLASALFSAPVVATSLKVDHIEDSSFVQSKVVMGTGVRRVQPLKPDQELEDDISAIDDDNPSLMQAEVCRKQSKSRLQPLSAEEINDEVSMFQAEAVVNRAQSELGDDEGIDEEEEFSAMQTSVVMMVGERHVGTRRQYGEEDAFDGASFMQSEATFTRKNGRNADSCANGQVEGTEDDDASDEVSLMQTDVVLNRQSELGDDDGIEEEEEFSAMQTSVVMMVGERHVGTGRRYGEEDTFDGASFMQNEATFARKNGRRSESCTNGQVEGTDDDDASDEVSLMQTDVVLNRAQSELGDDDGIEEEEEEFSAVQTSVEVMVGERHVGTGRRYGEEDAFDSASFVQNEAPWSGNLQSNGGRPPHQSMHLKHGTPL